MYVTHNNTRKFPENVSGRLEIYQRKKIPCLSLWIRHKRNSMDTRIVLKNVKSKSKSTVPSVKIISHYNFEVERKPFSFSFLKRCT